VRHNSVALSAWYNLASAKKKVLAKTNSHEIHHCDLSNAFSNIMEQTYYDDIHYTSLGNKILARELYKIISKMNRDSNQ
jgi:hypothetical protein